MHIKDEGGWELSLPSLQTAAFGIDKKRHYSQPQRSVRALKRKIKVSLCVAYISTITLQPLCCLRFWRQCSLISPNILGMRLRSIITGKDIPSNTFRPHDGLD